MFGDGAELVEYVDETGGVYRVAALIDRRLQGCLFVGARATVPQWDAVKALFESNALDDKSRRLLLSGSAADGRPDSGPLICACFGVGLAAIRDAIASRAATSVAEIGRALKAGTNCGSCLPELKKIAASA